LSNNYYNDKVEELAPQYLSLSFDDVHHNWAHHLPSILKSKAQLFWMLAQVLEGMSATLQKFLRFLTPLVKRQLPRLFYK